jgi:glycosyltransferase involved in cell wall biosynthesis
VKVLQVIPSLSPRLGGPTLAVKGFSKSLKAMGVDVQILTTDDDVDDRLKVPLHRLTSYEGIPTTFLPYTFRAKEFIYANSLSRWHRENLDSFDIVHTHYLFSYLPSWTARIARHRKIPYLMRPLGQLTPWALSQSANKKKLYASLLEWHNLRGAATIHCTSKEESDNVQDFGIQTPTVSIPLGVRTPKPIRNASEKLHQAYNIPQEIPVVLFLSRIHYKKQPEVLIKAASHLLLDQPCHIIFAGTGEPQYLNQLKTLVKTLNIESHVTFAGFVSGYRKDLLLQGSDVFALPSHSENFGVAVAEALISGLPVVIAPGIQISSEIKAANAGIVSDTDPIVFSSALRQVIVQPDVQNSLRKNGFKLAKNRYSWDAITRELINVYQRILLNNN